jgi:hypothetical protein
VIVMKFGGTSVGSAERIRGVPGTRPVHPLAAAPRWPVVAARPVGAAAEAKLVIVRGVGAEIDDVANGLAFERRADRMHHADVVHHHAGVLAGRPRRDDQQRIFGQFAFDATVLRHHRRELVFAAHRANVKQDFFVGRKNFAVLVCAETPIELPEEAWTNSIAGR